MAKIINIGGNKMILEDDGTLHPIPKKEYKANKRSENFAFKNNIKHKTTDNIYNIFTSINDKSSLKSKIATKVILNEYTMNLLQNDNKLRTRVYNKYGIHHVDHIISSDIENNIIYIHYDDMRYEVIYVGVEVERRKHFAETLLDDNNE